jgi:hypothetical protein
MALTKSVHGAYAVTQLCMTRSTVQGPRQFTFGSDLPQVRCLPLASDGDFPNGSGYFERTYMRGFLKVSNSILCTQCRSVCAGPCDSHCLRSYLKVRLHAIDTRPVRNILLAIAAIIILCIVRYPLQSAFPIHAGASNSSFFEYSTKGLPAVFDNIVCTGSFNLPALSTWYTANKALGFRFQLLLRSSRIPVVCRTQAELCVPI